MNNSQNTQQLSFNAVNLPYGYCLLTSNQNNRQGVPGPDVFQSPMDKYKNCVPYTVEPGSVGHLKDLTPIVNKIDQSFLQGQTNPNGTYSIKSQFGGNTDLQSERPKQPFENYYIQLAGKTLNIKPDLLVSLFFCDSNINHLRNTVVVKVQQITADSGVAGDNKGVTIKTPNMDDLFYYMVNIYKNYKFYNGSICFINLKNETSIKNELGKLNTNVLQDYVSKMVSQINMYIYYYKDASQLPQQLSLPTYTSMKGSKVLEYNNGFTSGNSMGIASYNEVGNIL